MPSGYNPATDATLNMWMDPRDTSTASLQKVGGGAIADGNTVGTWSSKKGPTRDFTQWGANALPSFHTNVINGLPAVRFQTQLITTQQSVTAFDGISGVTVMRVVRKTTAGAAIDLTCLDPNTGFSDITHWGQSGSSYFMNGWRRPRIDTFDSFIGDAVPASGIFITTSIWDWANAQVTLYQSGVEGPIFQTAFGSAGVSAATSYALSFGGFAQQSGLTGAALSTDGYIGETLIWLTAMTPTQLVPPHHYMRMGWSIN
jgi:hypothetical protein